MATIAFAAVIYFNVQIFAIYAVTMTGFVLLTRFTRRKIGPAVPA